MEKISVINAFIGVKLCIFQNHHFSYLHATAFSFFLRSILVNVKKHTSCVVNFFLLAFTYCIVVIIVSLSLISLFYINYLNSWNILLLHADYISWWSVGHNVNKKLPVISFCDILASSHKEKHWWKNDLVLLFGGEIY